MAVTGMGGRWIVGLVVFVLVSGMLGVDPSGAVVGPDGGGGVHEPAIEVLEAEGIFHGTECGDGLFCPREPILRWVIAVWLVRVLGEEPAQAGISRFSDVDAGEWWVPYVETLADLGVTKGCDTEPLRFCPDESVTRAQMASFLVRAFALDAAGSAGFADTAGNTHEEHIDALAAARYTAGCAVGPLRYCPDESVTRAEMATFLGRAVGLVPLPKTAEGPPTVEVLLDDVTDEDAGRFEVRVVFDEPVSGFERGDVVVVNGWITAFGGSGQVYRVSVERWAEGTVVVAVPAGVADDRQGDPNESSAALVWGRNLGPWIDTWDREAVLESSREEFGRRQPSAEFTGSIRDCKPGTTSQEFRDSIVRRVNWYRSMAGVQPVAENPDRTGDAQAAALIMAAQGNLSHFPPSHWRCWTTEGYEGASRSNLHIGHYGISGFDGYIRDPGAHNLQVGHRMNILDPWASHVSLGYVPAGPGANALSMSYLRAEDDEPQLREERGFVAWPPPGYVPARAVWGRWSFSLAGSSWWVNPEHAHYFSSATVTMFDHTGQIPTRIIAASMGRIVWAVAGDTNSAVHPQPRSADRCYTVTIRGVWLDYSPQEEPIQYATCVLADSTNPPQWPQHVALTRAGSGSVQTDREALVALYNSTDGPNWTSATNWNTDKPLDQWEGVSTDPSGRVTRLTLRNNSLSGSIPKEIGNLTGLSLLSLSQNRLTGPIPKEVGNLTGLNFLFLAFNALSDPIPTEVGNLTHLWVLALDQNQLSGPIPEEIGNITYLADLSLSGNQLSGPIPEEIGNITYLTDLNLGGNQLTGSIPRQIGKLTNLRTLNLANNDLSGPIPAELGNLIWLRTMDLLGNQLTGCLPKSLERKIRRLDPEQRATLPELCEE